ncbi:MAG: hypothetical protein H0V79_09845 [Actinobacteria bacterium]|nr:hypothetical protein [Actinomycetota bacterium]
MTTNFVTLAGEAQKQALAALKQAQELSLEATEFAIGVGSRQPSEVLAELPNPVEVVEGAFAFAGQVLQQQKDYALRMTELMTEAATRTVRGAEETVGTK